MEPILNKTSLRAAKGKAVYSRPTIIFRTNQFQQYALSSVLKSQHPLSSLAFDVRFSARSPRMTDILLLVRWVSCLEVKRARKKCSRNAELAHSSGCCVGRGEACVIVSEPRISHAAAENLFSTWIKGMN